MTTHSNPQTGFMEQAASALPFLLVGGWNPTQDFRNSDRRWEENNKKIRTMIRIKANNGKGYYLLEDGGVLDIAYPESKLRRGRVKENGRISGTLATSPTMARMEREMENGKTRYRIRKLTPREVWRLMSFTDADYDKAAAVNSHTQLYKQAGNSIVKDVLMAIFREML